MKLTKYTHSCIRLEKDGRVLVFDPGNFSEAAEALQGADWVLITHEHPDHLDPEPVHAFLAEHPETVVCAPASVAEQLREEVPNPERIRTVQGEERFELGPFSVRTYGGQHALIHPLIRTVDNVGYLIEERVYHPGDSLVVPDGITPSTVLVPLHAPWSKMAEVIDFLIAVRAQKAYPIHDALLSDNGFGIVEKQVIAFAAKYGTDYEHLDPGTEIEL